MSELTIKDLLMISKKILDGPEDSYISRNERNFMANVLEIGALYHDSLLLLQEIELNTSDSTMMILDDIQEKTDIEKSTLHYAKVLLSYLYKQKHPDPKSIEFKLNGLEIKLQNQRTLLVNDNLCIIENQDPEGTHVFVTIPEDLKTLLSYIKNIEENNENKNMKD